MGQRKIAATISIVLIIISIVSLSMRGLNLGLDFLGGTQVEVTYAESADLGKARAALDDAGFKDTTVVYFGAESEVMIRFHGSMEEVALEKINASLATVAPSTSITNIEKRTQDFESRITVSGGSDVGSKVATLFPETLYGTVDVSQLPSGETQFATKVSLQDAMTKSLISALKAASGTEVTLNYSESVDSQVGSEMLENALIGLLVALAVVMIYVALRFQYKFALGAVAALIHDVIITLGFFSVFDWDFDLTVFAAVLAVIGYSLNDTIVVSDRIRENFRLIRKATPIEIINSSLNQTLGRTLMTSFTTLLVLFALYLFGGEAIRGFAEALIVGIVIGTYSSIYVAANFMLALHLSNDDLIVPVKEGADLDELQLP